MKTHTPFCNIHYRFACAALIMLPKHFHRRAKVEETCPPLPSPVSPPTKLVLHGSVSFAVLSIRQSFCLHQSSPKDLYNPPSHPVPFHPCVASVLRQPHVAYPDHVLSRLFSWQFLGYVSFSPCLFHVQLHCPYVLIPPICLSKSFLMVCIVFLTGKV